MLQFVFPTYSFRVSLTEVSLDPALHSIPQCNTIEGKSAKDTLKLTSWISVAQLKVLGSLLNCISIVQYSQLIFQEFSFRLLWNSVFLESLEGKLVLQRPWGSFSVEGWVADVRLAGLFLTQLNLRRYYGHVCTLQLECKNETACPSLLACCWQHSTLSWSMCLWECILVTPGAVLTGSLPVQATNAVPKGLLGSSLDVLHTHPISLMRQSLNTVVDCILALQLY